MIIKKISFLLLSILFTVIASSQTADEIINRYITYTGGVNGWKKIRTATSSGTYNYGGMEFPFRSFSKSPDLYKYIVTFKGKSFMQSYDGVEGWRIDGFKNETKKTILKGREAVGMANENDVEFESPFINYHKKGHSVILEGKDTVNKKTCYKIMLIRNNGDTATCFFDSRNFALVKKQAVSKNTELNNSMLDIYYSDYRTTNGLKQPHKIICRSNGQDILIITVKEMKFNIPVADSLFKP